MVKCPKCKNKITHLNNIQTGSAGWEMRITKEGTHIYPEYVEMDEFFLDDGNENHFECPECNKILFYTEDMAIKFLQGKKLKKR